MIDTGLTSTNKGFSLGQLDFRLSDILVLWILDIFGSWILDNNFCGTDVNQLVQKYLLCVVGKRAELPFFLAVAFTFYHAKTQSAIVKQPAHSIVILLRNFTSQLQIQGFL